MNVMEYKDGQTTIRIHDDYVKIEEKQKTKEWLISLMINYLENKIN